MTDEELWKLGKSANFWNRFKHLFSEDDVFWNNEIKANLFVAFSLLILGIVLVISYVLTAVGVFDVPLEQMRLVLLVNAPTLFIAMGICQYFHGARRWIKYMLCVASLFVSIAMCSTISIFVTLVISIPVLLSTRYYSRKFTIFVAVISIIGMIISELIYGINGILDLNLVSVPQGSDLLVTAAGLRAAVIANGYDEKTYIINLFRGSMAPRLLLYSIIATTCAELARRAHEMVLEQQDISRKTEAMKTELNLATNIQESVLPKIFPAFPTRPDLDIFASMSPAKEVGGDFYDYSLIDDDHLFMTIADVSGKGVPAALFMMIAKMLIKTYAEIYKAPGAIAQEVNRQLCDGNEAEMFVTAWIGILEFSTGTFTAVDAGHEYPFVKRKDGSIEMIKGKKSFVLAGSDAAKYKEYSFQFHKGDSLFLYTDGVPEATNAHNELFGMERLEACLNAHKGDTPAELLTDVRKDVDAFVKEAPQFDDLTMVCMHYKED